MDPLARRIITILLAGVASPSVFGLTAYDCQDGNAKQLVLDTTTPAECPSAESDFLAVRDRQLQLLKTEGTWFIKTQRCAVFTTIEVTRCGFDSITYGKQTVRWEQAMRVSDNQCKEAFTKGYIEVEGRRVKVVEGVASHDKFFSHGSVSDSGACTTADFKRDGQWFRGSYEEMFIRVRLETSMATLNRAKGQLTFDIGLKGDYERGSLFDTDMGLLVWNAEDKATCTHNINEFWRGTAQVRPQINKPDRQGTIVMVGSNQDANRHLGFILGEPVKLCGRPCHKVDSLPGFTACFYKQGSPQLKNVRFNTQLAAADKALDYLRLKSHADFLFVDSELRTQDRFAQVVKGTCEVTRRSLFNKLQAVSGVGNKHALLDLFGKGHLLTPAGPNVAYLTKCQPVEVQKADYPNCTAEVPVRVIKGNATLHKEFPIRFMDAATNILRRFPTRLTCSAATPVRWKLQGEWWCSTPKMLSCSKPSQLKPEVEAFKTSSDFTKGITSGGLMSDAMREKVYLFQEEQEHRQAIMMEVTRNGLRNSDTNLGAPVSAKHMSEWSNDIIQAMSPSWIFNLLGQSTQFVLAILTFGSILWTVITATARFIVEFAATGWDGGRTIGRAILGCFGIFRIPQNLIRAAVERHFQGNPRQEPQPEPPRDQGPDQGPDLPPYHEGTRLMQQEEDDAPQKPPRTPPMPRPMEEMDLGHRPPQQSAPPHLSEDGSRYRSLLQTQHHLQPLAQPNRDLYGPANPEQYEDQEDAAREAGRNQRNLYA